jgi:hypothetical protein
MDGGVEIIQLFVAYGTDLDKRTAKVRMRMPGTTRVL